MVSEHDHSAVIEARFAGLGLRLTYGEHVDERDDFDSSSIASRVADLHAAFADPDVAAVLTVIGGFNSNELLPYLDWDLIAANPKVLCGFSDITALQNAILARTGLVTYSGPHWSSFGMRDHFEQTLAWFSQTLFTDEPVDLAPAGPGPTTCGSSTRTTGRSGRTRDGGRCTPAPRPAGSSAATCAR